MHSGCVEKDRAQIVINLQPVISEVEAKNSLALWCEKSAMVMNIPGG